MLPAIAILSSAHALRCSIMSLVTCMIVQLVVCWRPPRIDRGINVLLNTNHMLRSVAFLAATIAVMQHDQFAWAPPWVAPLLLYGGMGVVALVGCMFSWRSWRADVYVRLHDHEDD